jgi:predicted GIY-YIG superfamily endonuclease
MTTGIYRILNTKNSKSYIGSSVNIESRWKQHINSLKAGKHRNQYLQRSFNEHGIEIFSFSVVEITSKKELLEREKYWMDFYKSCDNKLGYNLYKDPTRPGYEKGCFPAEIRDRFGINRTIDFISPDGTIYKDIKNVTRFSQEQNLLPSAMNEVARGKRIVHKGWTKLGNKVELAGSGNRKRRLGKFNINIIDQLGNIFHVTNLQKFCEDYKLGYKALYDLVSGRSKTSFGFKLLK